MLLIGDRPFRALDSRSWDRQRRIADMDRDGVQMQVLSPMPELLSYWLDGEDAVQLGDHVNGMIAQLVSARPDRFAGLGMVPLQAPDRAARELERLRDSFGLQGVQIGSNVNGTYLGEEAFRPFFAEAEKLGMAVFVHALHPVIAPALGSRADLVTLVGFPIDTALSAAVLFRWGLLDAFPALRIGFSHGGGALAPLLHRMEFGISALDLDRDGLSPRAQAARCFFDSLVYDAGYLRYLAEHIAPGNLFLGTDYPYRFGQTAPRAFLEQSGLWSTNLANGAAHRFLGIEPSQAPSSPTMVSVVIP